MSRYDLRVGKITQFAKSRLGGGIRDTVEPPITSRGIRYRALEGKPLKQSPCDSPYRDFYRLELFVPLDKLSPGKRWPLALSKTQRRREGGSERCGRMNCRVKSEKMDLILIAQRRVAKRTRAKNRKENPENLREPHPDLL